MQSTILVILPTWAVFFAISLPPSADSAKINIISTNGKKTQQDVLKQFEANTDFFVIFSALSYIIKALLKQFPFIAIEFSH